MVSSVILKKRILFMGFLIEKGRLDLKQGGISFVPSITFMMKEMKMLSKLRV